MKTFIGTAGTPKVDTTGDMKPSMLVRLEFGLSPLEGIADVARRRLQDEPGCECGHAASVHYDHEGHSSCECDGYMPSLRERCVCRHVRTMHSQVGSCSRACGCYLYTPKEDD